MATGPEAAAVVVVGSVNYDVAVVTDRFPAPGETVLGRSSLFGLGGKGANQAVAARAVGAVVRLIAAIGADERGEAVRRELMSFGVPTDELVVCDSSPTGTAHITITPDGGNSIVVAPGANASLSPEGVAGALAPTAAGDVLVIQGEISPSALARAVAVGRAGGLVVMVNLAPVPPSALELLDGIDWLVVNEVEFAQLVDLPYDTPMSELLAALERTQLAPKVVVSLGESGALLKVGDDAVVLVAAPPVAHVVDTTGAGDALVGVLAASVARGIDAVGAVTGAVNAASRVVTRIGAAPSYEVLSPADIDGSAR